MAHKTCTKCGVEKSTPEDFYPDKYKADGFHGTCKECTKADRKRRYTENPAKYNAQSAAYQASERGKAAKARAHQRLVDATFAAYGAECACCGEWRREFLTVDHVGEWGAEHRKESSAVGGNIHRWLRDNGYPQDGRFQILCWNCNCAKGVRGGCPHDREREASVVAGVDLR